MDKLIKTSDILNVYDLYTKLIENNTNVLLVLDIDDTILSSQIGKTFVDNNVKILVNKCYDISENNLLFLTARNKSLNRYTKNKLNSCGLLHKGKYINYNIICSPHDEDGNSTKGKALIEYLKHKDNIQHIIFVDNEKDNIDSVYIELSETIYKFTLFYYKFI